MKKKKKADPVISSSDKRFRTMLVSVLRRFSKFWQPKNNALKKARLSRGVYQCSTCSTIVSNREIKVDHIEPVIPITGFTNWDDFINRLFCEESGLQAICEKCHAAKTLKENEARKIFKKSKSVIQSDEEN